jgi:hypothetical protein
MPQHSAKSLFDLNIASAEECLSLFAGVEKLKTSLKISWLLRASVVFAVSSLDAYFHDKVRYRAGRFGLTDMPPAMASFTVPLKELSKWEDATRKGNVLRGWLTSYYSTRPLQRRDDIANALKVVGISDLWATIEPDSPKRDALFDEMAMFVKRRNQIAHEGDRESSRRSGKRLRDMDTTYAQSCIDFTKMLVDRIERAFPG